MLATTIIQELKDVFSAMFFDQNVRNPSTFPTESLAHGSGRTLVRAEYGHSKESQNTNS
jgi:hypothetical protein